MYMPTDALFEEAAKRCDIINKGDPHGCLTGGARAREWYKDGYVHCTDAPGGHEPVYLLSGKDVEDIRKFEEEHNGYVYHVINYFYGLLYVYLYVTEDNQWRWEAEKDHLRNHGLTQVYINTRGTTTDGELYYQKGMKSGYRAAEIATSYCGLPYIECL